MTRASSAGDEWSDMKRAKASAGTSGDQRAEVLGERAGVGGERVQEDRVERGPAAGGGVARAAAARP